MTDVHEYFGASEYVEYDADNKQRLIKIIVAIVIVLAVALLIWYVARRIKINGMDQFQREVQASYEQTGGDQKMPAAERVVRYGEQIPNPTAIDHFRIGVVQLNNMHDRRAAHEHFREAAVQIEQNEVARDDALYILGRIRDFEHQFLEDDDLERIDVQRAIFATIERPVVHHTQTNTTANRAPRIEINIGDEQRVQKTLLNQQYWTSEPQNVHDQNISAELKRQYAFVSAATDADKSVAHRDYSDCCRQLEARLRAVIDADRTPAHTRATARETLNRVQQVFNVLSNNTAVGLLGCTEQELVTVIWRRIHQECNAENKEALCTALQDSIADCVEHGNVVCQTGRTEKIWAALAMLDAQQGIGVFKTRQAMLNEISDRAARIVDKYVGPESGIRYDVLQDFNGEKIGEEAQQIERQIVKEILDMKAEYTNRLDEPFLTNRINECLAVVQ